MGDYHSESRANTPIKLQTLNDGALKCYQCDGVRGTDLPCEGNGNIGREVECPDKCGLMLHQILHFDKWHSSVVSTDSRWRRGCTSDGSEITADSEMAGKSLSGDLGCQKIGDRSQDNQKHTFTLCVCNTTLCNENSGSVPISVKITLTTLCLTLSLLF